MSNQDKPLTRIREIVQIAMKEKGITMDDVRADLAAYRRGEEYTYGEDYIKVGQYIKDKAETFFADMLMNERKLIERAKLLKSPEITLDTPEKVEMFNKLISGKEKVNDELIQKIKNTPTIPRRIK